MRHLREQEVVVGEGEERLPERELREQLVDDRDATSSC
jgi:hypothetical protein